MDHMHLHSVDSYQQMQAEVQPEDLYVQYNTNSSGSKTGFKAPLTRVVATPCYRWAAAAWLLISAGLVHLRLALAWPAWTTELAWRSLPCGLPLCVKQRESYLLLSLP